LCSIAKAEPVFTGLASRVRLTSEADDEAVLDRLVDVLGLANIPRPLSELSLRVSSVVESRFFDNMTVQSFREWPSAKAAEVVSLPVREAASRGIEFVQDFNDRFAFNEQSGYATSSEACIEIVERAQASMKEWMERLSSQTT
jgi:hypothetical protein